MRPKNILLLLFFMSSLQVRAMLFDNRFFFLLRQPITRLECQPFHFTPLIFLMTADKAFDDLGQETLIPNLNGQYNQVTVANALVEAGVTQTNLIPPDLRSRSTILWNIDSKIEGQGIALRAYYRFFDLLEMSAGIYFIHARQGYEFSLADEQQFTIGERKELFASNQQIKEALGVVPAQWDEVSPGDAYVQARIGGVWEYMAKFRRIDAGAFAGILGPLALDRDINNPASLALGGDGHFGAFGGFDAQFELKEDWVAGFEVVGLKRFQKDMVTRLPFLSEVNKDIVTADGVQEGNINIAEPINYGVVVSPTLVDPGATVYFAPYFAMERIRDGLGIRFIYYLIRHGQDRFTTQAQANVARAEELSSWGADIITANLTYDFGYYKEERDGSPVLSFAWYAPVDFIVAKRSSRTHTISLSLEVGF